MVPNSRAGINKRLFCKRENVLAMAALRVGRKSLVKRYSDKTRSLLKMAAALPDRPSPDEIHDLRVAVRRVQMMRRLVPRRVGGSSQDSKSFDLALRSVMKVTSQLRDMDTLMDTLKSYKGTLSTELLVNLENRRSDAAARAKAGIIALAKTMTPEVDISKVRGKRLSKRLRKRVQRHSNLASAMLAGVLKDESKAEELHSLRKEIKKIRYLIELADKTPARFSSLAEWQQSLGAIHDLDVAISYLKAAGADPNRRAILELRKARHSNYLKFVRDHGTAQMQTLREWGALPLGLLVNVSPTEA